MAKFPQFEWMEIDGRMVPSIKPQHYKKGSTTETQLTGHDNPLPVANYTQNDSGVWLPTSKDNPVPTQVTGSNAEEKIVENITVSANSSVDSGTIPLEGVNSISVGAILGRAVSNNPIKIYFRWRNGLGQFMDNSRNEFEYHTNVTGNHLRILTERTELVSSRLVIYFENTSGEDINLTDVYIYKYT